MIRMSRFTKDTSGAAAVLFSFALTTMAMIVAVVANLSLVYLDKRKFQSAVDLASLEYVTDGGTSDAQVRAFLISYGLDVTETKVSIETGLYKSDPTLAHDDRFTPSEADTNALKIQLEFPVRTRIPFAGLKNENKFSVEAIATRRSTASLWMGSRLLRLEGGLSEALLNALVGYEGRISVMDYEQLLDLDVDVLSALEALRLKTDTTLLTYNEVLRSDIKLGDLATSLNSSPVDGKTNMGLELPSGLRNEKIRLDKIIRLGDRGNQEIDAGRPKGEYHARAGEVLFAALALANGDRQIGLEADLLGSLAEVTLGIGDPAKFMTWNYDTMASEPLHTAQTELSINALNGSTLLNTEVRLELAEAEAEITRISCKADRSVKDVYVDVSTSPAELVIDPPLLRAISVSLSSGEVQEVRFTAKEIQDGTTKTVRSGMGVELNRVPLLYRPIAGAIDELLVGLGLHLGEADIRVTHASCTRPFLVR
jgi:uncharacterized membrane protein